MRERAEVRGSGASMRQSCRLHGHPIGRAYASMSFHIGGTIVWDIDRQNILLVNETAECGSSTNYLRYEHRFHLSIRRLRAVIVQLYGGAIINGLPFPQNSEAGAMTGRCNGLMG